MPWPGRLHLVDDAAQPAALVVPEALGDPEGARVGHQDGEAPGQRDLLGQAGALGPDRVLGHLAQDGLAGLEHVLDPGLLRRRPALDVVTVVAHVAPVQDGVLGDPDVDEGRLHAGQHVLDPAPVDVAVDLVRVVGRPGHVVLDQRAALEHGDLGHVRLHVDADQVAAHLLGAPVPAGATPAAGPLGRPSSSAVGGRPSAVAGRGLLRRGRPRAAPAARRAPTALGGGGAAGAGRVSPIFGLRGAAGRARASGGLVPPAASGGGPSGVWLISVSDMRESPPRVLCRVATPVPGPLTGSGSNRAPSRSIH